MNQCTNNIPVDVAYSGSIPKVMNKPDIVARHLTARFNNAVDAVALHKAQLPMPQLDANNCDTWKTSGSIPADQYKPFKEVMATNDFIVSHGKPANACVCHCN